MSEETKKEETPNAETEKPQEEAQAPAEQSAESTSEAAPAEKQEEAAAPAEEAPKAEQIEGKVKWFSNVKGYGFLTADGQDRDIFVHYSSIQSEGYKTLNEAEEVSFQVIESDKGPQAANVIRKKKEAAKEKQGEEAKS